MDRTKTPAKKSDKWPKDVAKILDFMVENDIEISCYNLTDFWSEEWTECPLCGGRLELHGDEGSFILHYMVQ